jgi:hypothetical protein
VEEVCAAAVNRGDVKTRYEEPRAIEYPVDLTVA